MSSLTSFTSSLMPYTEEEEAYNKSLYFDFLYTILPTVRMDQD